MARILVGGKIRKFDPNKHKRDARGRFADKPDVPKASKEVRRQSKVLNETKKAAEIYKARLEIINSLSPTQRAKLGRLLEAKRSLSASKPASVPKATPEPPKAAQEPTKKTRKPRAKKEPKDNQSTTNDPGNRPKFTKNTDKSILKKYAKDGDLSKLSPDELKYIPGLRSPTPRPPGNPSNIKIDDQGKVTIWDGKKEAKYDESFKVRTNKKQEYKVTADDGTELVLNRHRNVISYKGETVEGVPSLHPRLREMSNESLMKALVETQGHVENKQAPPPAPEWKQRLHGAVDKKYVAQRGYGGMEIHHIDQWAKTRFDKITKDYDDGVITLDEAKDQMRGLLRANPKEKVGYEIDIQDKSQRRFVVLAAGTHNFTSPLYEANHPLGIHPDTGKREKFGIPKNGDGGRGEFNTWRDGFWREVYRRETYVLLGELNRRVSKGDLSRDDARRILQETHQKATKSYDGMLEYKKNVDKRNVEIKEAKKAAGLK